MFNKDVNLVVTACGKRKNLIVQFLIRTTKVVILLENASPNGKKNLTLCYSAGFGKSNFALFVLHRASIPDSN